MNAPQSKSSTNALQQNLDYFFTPRTASFAALATREFKDGLGGNLYLLLRLGIEARACFPLLLHQLAKTGQDEFTVHLDLFECERAERIEEYACGFFVGLGRSRECDFEVQSWSSNRGFMAAELHHFKRNAQGSFPAHNPHRRVPLR